VLVCASCGAENREGARFCDACGTALEARPTREVRKVVTVLFCDVTGSTALGERIDPESLRRVMGRYFETAKAIVERHGGTVEKFIGDAVMAVFGVPTVHEDDALRGVRAADELRTGLAELNEELERNYGTHLELRMGLNTGEVVTGTEERLATGDAVNVAARLEQAAQPGEVLLGEETYRLVREAVVAQPASSIEAKGKAEPLRAQRLVSIHVELPSRRHDAPMIGRERQRRLLEHAFANVVSERVCHLFTILGSAGVGKSRLAREFLGAVENTTVVSGRCLSYGEGISYWPVTQVVKQLVAEGSLDGPLASILGDASAASSPQEIAWAFRKLLEAHAADEPVILVFEDVHWGEPAFLDLVEHVADLSRDAPILLLCMARPELLDARPVWGGGKLNATNVLLEPLRPDETAQLLGALGGDLPDGLRGRILEAAGGNPLFVEEMVAVAAEGDGDVAVPPTIQALLAARLDQLDPAERVVLERGAVEGQVFHRGAIAALSPDEPQVDGRLVTLVRKDLVRPEPAVIPNDDAYRFRHLLIRDTAYDALPKATRAQLHERFATWLDEHGGDLIELDEIVGYHLEQAFRYRAELGPLDDDSSGLGARAARRLRRGADRAGERGDIQAAKVLLSRAVELLPADADELGDTQLELTRALVDLGSYDEAEAMRREAVAVADATGDERLLARAALARVELQAQADPGTTMEEALAVTERMLAELERLDDEEGAVWALRLTGTFRGWLGQSAESLALLKQALERAEHLSPRIAADIVIWMMLEFWWGSTPTDEGLRRCVEISTQTRSKRVEAMAMIVLGSLKAARGEPEDGRREVADGRSLLLELNDRISWGGTSMIEGEIELALGNAEAAYDVLAAGEQVLSESAETGYLSSVVATRAQAALALGREDEALALADDVERLAAADDFEPRTRAHTVRGLVLSRRGELAAAAVELDEAAALCEPTDYSVLRLWFALARVELARASGQPEAERAALERALALAEAKAYLVHVHRLRGQLDALVARG
jgi:class 3 adenylate cyclase/tetratricopeptide (TPR) repeat protein